MDKLYSSLIESKTGFEIPVFSNNKPMHSKYDPIREAQTIIQSVSKSDFYIILGLGSGFIPKLLKENQPDCNIIIIENSDSDIDFLLSNIKGLKEYINETKIILTTINQIDSTLKQYFLPVFYNNLSVIEIRSWMTELNEKSANIKKQINYTLDEILRDYATQAHFGKIWQKNIIDNLKLFSPVKLDFNTKKTAYIIAAGPSLDDKIQEIKENIKNICIISTDTAYSTLKKYNINPDVICSLDGQLLSLEHFKNNLAPLPLFVFDLQANSSAARKIKNENGKIIFTKSNHPLVSYCDYHNSFNFLYSGSGTVTIMAVDLALKAGFKTIKIIGADFSYPHNKPYAKGTYLDSLYNNNSLRISTSQTKYSSLMFKTELFVNNYRCKTTKLLESYKNSFEKWLHTQNLAFIYKDFIYTINNNNPVNKLKETWFSYEKFIEKLKKDCSIFKSNIKRNNSDFSELEIALLPYIAFLKAQLQKTQRNIQYNELVKLALQNIVRYT